MGIVGMGHINRSSKEGMKNPAMTDLNHFNSLRAPANFNSFPTRSLVHKNDNQLVNPSLFNTVRQNFIALKYKTKIEVDGLGEYQIEITNVVNTGTLIEKPLIPSLLNVANLQKAEANKYKRIMQK